MAGLENIATILAEAQKRNYENSPWINTGYGLNQAAMRMPAGRDAWKAALAAALLGGAGGLMQGIGVKQAENKNTRMSEAYVDALKSANPLESMRANEELAPIFGSIASVFQADQADRLEKADDRRFQLANSLAQKGMVMNDKGIGLIPGYGESQANLSFMEKNAQNAANFDQIQLEQNQKRIALENNLNNDFIQMSNFKQVRESAGIMESLANSIRTGTKGDELDFIFGAAKILDPQAGLDDTPYGKLIKSSSIPDKVLSYFNSIIGEKKVLGPEDKLTIYNSIANRYNATRDQLDSQIQDQREFARRNKLNPENVARVPSFRRAESILKTPGAKVDQIFDKILQTESNYNPNAVSPKGAKGIAQLMDGTGQELARKAGVNYQPFDEEQNKKLAKDHLERDLLPRYNGDMALALAAYNWGMGNLDSLIAKKKSRDIGVLFPYLPNETKNYLLSILGDEDLGTPKARTQPVVKQQTSQVQPQLPQGQPQIAYFQDDQTGEIYKKRVR